MLAIHEKAKKIRLLILDVDGVLTSGVMIYGQDGAEYRGFHAQDGFGMRILQKQGIPIAIITAKKSASVTQRMNDLNILYVYQGQQNKLVAYEEIKIKLQLSDQEIAYVGDDFPDLPVLRQVGLAITVPGAPDTLQQQAHWVTQRHGGQGAVREVCELLLKAQNLYANVIDSYS